jgi:RHS repeat-associated protein
LHPKDPILRADLAWITVAGLFGNKAAVPELLYTEYYIVPYQDLADEYKDYYRYPKMLSYLAFEDKITPFNYERANFEPYNPIWRSRVLKVYLEAFNIKPDAQPTAAAATFFNISPALAEYKYIAKAFDLKLLKDFQPADFVVTENMTRGEAFKILYRIMKAADVQRPTVAQLKDKTSFLRDDHLNKASFAQKPALVDGNFEHHETSVFNIPDIKTNLHFKISYHSFLKPKPKDWSPYTPLGVCWTHSQNSYIRLYDSWISGKVGHPAHYTVTFPGAPVPHVWGHTTMSTSSKIKSWTENVYYDFKITGNIIQITLLDKTVFTFERKTDGDPKTFWLISVKDRNGNETNYDYERFVLNGAPHYRLMKVTAPSNRYLTMVYESATSGRLTQVKGPGKTGNDQRSIRFEYEKDDLTKFVDVVNAETKYTYHKNTSAQAHLLNLIQLPKGNYISNEYDDNHLKSSKTIDANGVAKGVTVETVYDHADGTRMNVVKDLNGNEIDKVVYDDARKVGSMSSLRAEAADGTSKTTFEFKDPNHPRLPTRATNELTGISVSSNYNAKGQVVRKITVGGTQSLIESWDYEDNFLKSYTNPKNHTMVLQYDPTHKNVLSMLDFEGNETSFGYDAEMGDKGLVTSVTSPTGVTYQIRYNRYGNPATVTAPNGIYNRSVYDFSSRVTESFNPKKDKTQYAYRDDDLLETVINPEGKATKYGYTDNKFLKTIQNANQGVTTLEYNYADDLLKSQEFGGEKTEYIHDYKGRLKQYKKPRYNDFKTIEYFQNDMVKSNGFYRFDLNEKDFVKTKQLESTPNNRISYTYDDFNRIESYTVYYPTGNGTGFSNYTMRYAYDANSNPIELWFRSPTVPTEIQLARYEYDKNNRLQAAYDKNGQKYEMVRRSDGTPDKLIYPNGMVKRYHYDDNNRLEKFGYYTSEAESVDNTLASYAYTLDDLGFIEKETYREPLAMPVLPNASETYAPNAVNRYTSITTEQGKVTQQFDLNGNQETAQRYQMTWSSLDQLSSLTEIGGFNLANTFNVNGLRCAATRNQVTTRYAHDLRGIGNVMLEMDAQGLPTAYYLYGFEEGMLSRVEVLADNKTRTRYYVHDARGSTVAMTDENQRYTHKYVYSNYGEVADQWMAAGERENRYTFVGAYGVEMENTQLFYMRARFYDAKQKRFLAQDPIWNVNLYAYAGNNPVMGIDPTGQVNWGRIGTGALAIAIAVAAVAAAPMTGGASVVEGLLLANTIIGGQIGVVQIIVGAVEADADKAKIDKVFDLTPNLITAPFVVVGFIANGETGAIFANKTVDLATSLKPGNVLEVVDLGLKAIDYVGSYLTSESGSTMRKAVDPMEGYGQAGYILPMTQQTQLFNTGSGVTMSSYTPKEVCHWQKEVMPLGYSTRRVCTKQ